MWDTPLDQLTDTQLDEHRRQCWEREAAIGKEQDRRRALPYVWANETQIVKSLRAALNNAPEPGAAWAKPANITAAYIAGDTVTHEGKRWQASGDGAILHAPGTAHPIMGERWVELAGQD